MTPFEAYQYAWYNHTELDFDLEYYQKIACKNPKHAHLFAINIPNADIKYCQKYACEDLYFALLFARDVPGADIEYCRKVFEDDPYYLNAFDKMIAKKAMS